MPNVAIVGNVNVETTIRIPTFPLTYTPTIYTRFGITTGVSGVGYNLAKALHTLGNTVTLASVIGHDPQANLIRTQLEIDRVSTHYLVSAVSQSAQSVILYDGEGKRTVLTDLKDVPEAVYPIEHFAPALARSDLVILTNIAYSKPFISLAKAYDKLIATDLHTLADLHDAYNAPFLEHADVLFLSGELLTVSPESWASAIFASYPAQIVVIGLGARGAYLAVRNRETIHIPAVITRDVVQTGGAGDALFAAFIHSYLSTNNPVLALRMAVVFASYKIGEMRSGEGFLTASQLEMLAASIYSDA